MLPAGMQESCHGKSEGMSRIIHAGGVREYLQTGNGRLAASARTGDHEFNAIPAMG